VPAAALKGGGGRRGSGCAAVFRSKVFASGKAWCETRQQAEALRVPQA